MEHEMIDSLLHNPELLDRRHFPEDVDGGERVEHAAAWGDQEVGPPSLDSAELRQAAAAVAGRGIEAPDVARAIPNDGERVGLEIGEDDFSTPVRVGIENLHVHALGQDVQPALRAFERNEPAVAASVLNPDRAAERRLDGLSLEVKQGFSGRENGPEPRRRRQPVVFEVAGEEVERARVAVHLDRFVVVDRCHVLLQSLLPHVERR
jgi:hypothetical protein